MHYHLIPLVKPSQRKGYFHFFHKALLLNDLVRSFLVSYLLFRLISRVDKQVEIISIKLAIIIIIIANKAIIIAFRIIITIVIITILYLFTN